MRKTDTKANPKSYAANKLVPGVNDLATTNPEVAAEWDYEKNGDLLPSQIAQFSNKSVWWKCKAHGHSWKTQVASRTRGNGCPVCAGKIILPGFNDLASTEPEIAAQWDHEKNGTLTPSQVARYSMKKVWWRCDKGHSYLQPIASRTSQHQGCPYCSGAKVLRGFNDLCTTHPEIAADWNYEKNGDLKPWEISHGSPKKVWWKCKNGHEYFDTPNHRTSPYSNRSCPYCSGKKVLVGFNDMATTNPEMAAAWNYEKNGDLKPTDVTDCSGKIVWWKCENGHEYRQKISNKKSQQQGCPYCSGKQVLPGFNDLYTTNPEVIGQWDFEKNGALTPAHVNRGSGKKVWWKCEKGHEYQQTVANKTLSHQGCPYCSGHSVLQGYNDLQTRNPILAAQWDFERNESLLPSQVSEYSQKIVFWKCEVCGGHWKSSVANRSNGNGCPHCKREAKTSFPEQAIYYFVKRHFPDAENGYRSPDITEYDVFIPSKESAIEYDGQYYHNNKISKEREQLKDQVSKSKGIALYRVKENSNYSQNSPFQVNGLTIEYNPQKEDSLNQVIEYLLSLLGIRETISVEESRLEIYKQYVKSKKANSLQAKNQNAVLDWDWNKNNGLTPENISFASHKRVHWKCHVCGHEWVAAPHDLTRDRGCSICAEKARKEKYYKTKLKHNGSFKDKYPTLAAEWDYEKNGADRPEQYTCGSSKPFWWKCSKCGYSWQTSIKKRIDSSCPNCGSSDEQLALDGWDK